MKTLLKIISKVILFLWDWNIVGTIPNFSKAIIIVAPHRKGFFDVLLGLLVQNIHHIPNKKFLAKYEALQLPIAGWVLKQIGAIGVDRKREVSDLPKGYYIEEMANLIRQEETITLVIAPEGTRTPGVVWKKGFYEIARKAGIPIIMVAFDYDRKRVIIRETPLIIPDEQKQSSASFKDEIIEWYDLQTFGKYIPNIS